MAAVPKFKFTEWRGSSGNWHTGDVSALSKDSNNAYLHAQTLGLSLPEYQELIAKYEPDHNEMVFNEPENQRGLILFWWKDQAKMRKFKNYINKCFRERAKLDEKERGAN